MSISKLITAVIAFAVMAIPARADLVLLFLDSPTQVINDFVPFGNQLYDHGAGVVPAVEALNNPFAAPGSGQNGNIVMSAGQTRIIQLALLDTLIGNTFPPLNQAGPPASSIPAQGVYTNPRWLSNGNGTGNIRQMFGLDFWKVRIAGTVIGPPAAPTGGAFIAGPSPVQFVDPGYGNNRLALVDSRALFFNTASSMPPVFSNFGGFILDGNGANLNYDYLNFLPTPELGGRIPLFNFEITVPESSPSGTYPITVSDQTSTEFPDITVKATGAGGVGTFGDRIGLDSVIFSAAHPTYTLNVTVTPVPEPSSM